MKKITVKKTILPLATLLFVSGCVSSSDQTQPDPRIQKIEDSVAQQVLGEGAISVYPFAYQSVSAPGIYAVRANEQTGRHSYVEICSIDMKIPAIANMEVIERAEARTYKDSLSAQKISVSTPFVAAKTKYTMQSVDGYKASSVKSGGSSDAVEWVLENVGDKCKALLPKNAPYFVVAAVATSSSINVEKGGGVEIQPFNIGIANVEVELSERGRRVINSERVFAISGKLFRGNKVTSHGSY